MNYILRDFVESITQKRLNLFHVMVHQHGELLDKFSWISTDRRGDVHSASKSVTSMAAGIAIQEGVFSMDTAPAEVLSKHLPEEIPEHLLDVKVRHLLTMSVGRDTFLMPGYSKDPRVITRDQMENTDWINYAFSQKIPYEPGTHFMYDNSCPYLISAMIQEITGETMLNWLRPRLFEPMNIRNPQWLTDPQGRSVGVGGLQLTCEEFSRFGLLCLAHGNWKGKQLVPEEYMRDAAASHIICHPEKLGELKPGQLSVRHDYGYFFWRFNKDDIYYMSGWGGQGCIMIPELDACVTFKGYEFNGNEILRTIYDTILPKLRETYSQSFDAQTAISSEEIGVKEVSPWG